MFANSLCDSPGADRSGADRSWAIRSHRGWDTLASFAAQALAVGALLVLPLIYTQGLPRLQLMAALVAPPPPPAPPPGPARVRPANLSASNTLGTLVSPPTIPNEIAHIIDSELRLLRFCRRAWVYAMALESRGAGARCGTRSGTRRRKSYRHLLRQDASPG
jgi:hypothetical protein